MAFDQNKYKEIFEKRYGSGSFESGLSQAREIGRTKAQAEFAKQAFNDYVSKKKKESTKKTYDDALTYWSDPTNKEAIRSKGVYRTEQEIRNDPRKKKEIKDAGFSIDDFIDGMYSAGTEGESRSKREYDQKRKQNNQNVQEYDPEKPLSLIPIKQDKKNLLPKVEKKSKKKDKSFLTDVKDFVTSKDTNGDGQRDGLLGTLDRFVLPISVGATEFLAPGNNERMIQNDIQKHGKITNPVNKASLVDRGTETKVLHGAGTLLAAVAPYGRAYKGADYAFNKLPKLAGAVTNPYAQKAIKGALAGGMAEGGLSATNELFNSEANNIKDYAKRTAFGVAGGAIGDPLLHGLGQVIPSAANRTMRNLLPKNETIANELANAYKSSNALPVPNKGSLMNGLIPQGNGITNPNFLPNLMPKPKPQVTVPKVGTPLEEALANPKAKTLDDFTPNESPLIHMPGLMDEVPTPNSVKLEDILKQYGHTDATPENIANAYNQRQWYHGTGTNGLTANDLDPLAGNHEGLFGHGIYMTDSAEIANGYAKSRGKKTSNPTIYGAKVNMNRVLDLEKPIPDDAKVAVDKFTKSLDYQYNREFGENNYFSNIADEMASKGGTTEEIIQRLRNEVKDFSHEAGISTSEFVENFQDLAINLKTSGYDGITHTGGGRTGHDPHRVLIGLDPNDWYAQTGRTGQITDFKPNNPNDLLSQLKLNKWNSLKDNPKTSGLDEALKFLDETPSKPETNPKATANPKTEPKVNQEFTDAVQQQYEYLKNSMGKGVDQGTTSNGLDGNFKQVTGTYSVSRNPKWYQDFYAQNGRKPNDKELWQLAEKHVKDGFQDEVGNIPPWSPKKVQEIDQEIEQVTNMIHQSPEQEAVLNPILAALKEDRSAALKEVGFDPKKQYQYLKVKDNGKLPEGVQAMQSEIIPLRAPSGKKVKPITRQELMNNTRKNLGVTLRHGRLGNVDDNVSGYFKVDSEVIRTKHYGDVSVISHEVGHHLDKQFKLTNPAFDQELLKLGANTSGKGYTTQEVRDEGLAEFIRLYLTDPQKALSEAPKFSQHFETTLPKKVKAGLLKTQGDMDRWIEQGPDLRLRGKIDRTGKDQSTVGEKVDKLYSQFIDKFDRLKKVEKSVTGKISSAEQSLYKKARLSAGAPKKAEMILRDFKGILKPIEKYGYNMKDVSDYSTAVHAKELEALDIESGMTKEEVEKVIAKYNTPEMNQVHQGILKYNNELLNKLQEGQILSKEAVDAMKQKYPNYVPFYRFFEDDIAQGLGNKGFANLTNPVKRLKGSTRDVIDPLESMVKNTFAVVNAVEKNKVGLELSRLADVEGAGKFVERLHGAQDVKKEHIVTVFEKGEKVQYQLDKDLYEAIQQLDEDVTNKVIQFLSVPTSTLRAGATLTPEFMLRNPIRDQFQAYVVSNSGYKPIIDLPVGAWKVFRGKVLNKDGLYKQWAKEGGGYGNYLSQDRNYLRETLNTMKKEGNRFQKGFKTIVNPKDWIKILQSMSEFTEEATKVGEFRRAIKKGATPQEAAFQSRDLMDFGRVGSDMKQWNRAVAFLNANIQGKDKIARAFKQNPVRTTVRAIIGVTMPAIGAYMAMDKFANEKQKETYENTPKWMKDTFFILPIPGTDELARIPKPFDLAPVFANPVEQVMDYIKDNDPDTWGEFLKRQAISVSSIPHMLTGLAPIIENVTNYSFFTGGPIVPRRDQDLLPEDQYGVTTSLTARTVGKMTGTSPYKTDNLIRGYGAGLGKYATSGVDNLLKTLNVGKLPPQEQKKWSELPVVNAFTVDSTGGGQIMTDFYDAIDKLTKERNSAQRNQEGYEKGDDVNYSRVEDYKYLNKVSREISDSRKEYRSIQSSYELSPQQKRLQLDELDRQMNRLAREALIKIGEKTK